MKTLFLSIQCVVASSGMLLAEDALVKSFASCAGRYSAEMEHAWLINDPRAHDYELRRGGFVSLLDATTTAGNARQVLEQRVNAKHAHASLLRIATFNADAKSADAARRAASRLLQQCDFLILGGA